MSTYHIRLYKGSDYHTVRDIFARGIKEHIGVAFRHTLSLPRIWIPSLVVTSLPLVITGSYLTSMLVATTILGFLWFINRRIFTTYVNYCLRDDMLDIKKYYFEGEDRCFWVAESDGEIAGTAAAAPLFQTGREKQMELKRLSVPRRHRRRGIAKALCRTVIDFSRKRGYKAVVLETSLYQTSSWKLYEKMGFRRTHHCHPEVFCAPYIDFIDVYYQYDILNEDEYN